MSKDKKTKINQLVNSWTRGTVMTQIHLTAKGYDANLMRRYKEGQWVRSIGPGAFALFNDDIEWQGGLYTLQQQLNLDVHVGGKSVIELLGSSHYVRFASPLFLFAPPKTAIPKWFKQMEWGKKIVIKKSGLLPFALDNSFTKIKHRDFSIRFSTLERAALEMLYFVPDQQGFDEALNIFSNLINLRPSLLQQLLEQCSSVKVKRLFLYMAEKTQLPAFEQLQLEHINLGEGKRQIIKNGQVDKKYLITVPKQDSNHG